MSWLESLLTDLEDQRSWAYTPGAPPATEPTALAAMALLGHGRAPAAQRACDLLAQRQGADGSLGINAVEKAPHWATSLAVLAWQAADNASAADAGNQADSQKRKYAQPIEQAVKWILSIAGQTMRRDPGLGHDTTLRGWPWVEGTHSWIEPTAYCVLALRATGHANHARTREAVRLLVDRLLPEGGCNYGNTMVLNQWLRPHLEPTGLALMALAGEAADQDGKLNRTIDYAAKHVGPDTTAFSLALGLLGLAAHDRWPKQAPTWLEQAVARNTSIALALPRRPYVALAALGTDSPLVALARTEQPA